MVPAAQALQAVFPSFPEGSFFSLQPRWGMGHACDEMQGCWVGLSEALSGPPQRRPRRHLPHGEVRTDLLAMGCPLPVSTGLL